MYESLVRQSNRFHLYVFAFDNQSLELLRQLQLPHLTVISLSEFEDEQLLAVKPSRSRGEYCWTSTPSTILYVLERFGLDHCTYLDADLYFFADPAVLLKELGTQSVLITAHRFSAPYADALLNGKYCVQFMTFRSDVAGLRVLHWWRQACLDWCYNRLEDGKFGDQKYLDDWTTRFEGVHELRHLGGGVAPWNVQQYLLHLRNGKLHGREDVSGTIFPVIFYHFHGLRFLQHNRIDLCEYDLADSIEHFIYRPYLRHLDDLTFRLRQHFTALRPHEEVIPSNNLSGYVHNLERKIRGHYHIYNKNDFLNRVWPG